MKILAAPLVVLASAAPLAAKQAPEKSLAGIDKLIQRALAEQKIPGAVVGVVVGDAMVLLQGYGQRDIEADLPMTPDTMMPIASVTKQFTVAALGTLVRQGKLEWDKPVRDYLPDFRLHDDYATLHATPRDLVTHRIGLPRHDFAWFGSALSRQELYGRLRYFPFSRDIRTEFQYNNFMFMTAGYLAGHIAHTSYEECVRAALFEPLGMTRTNFSLATVAKDSDHATGYQLDNERKLVPDPFESVEQMAPTGGINSTARDLVQWLRMLLGGGELDGKRILQQNDVEAMLEPAVPIGPALFPEIGYRSYGMGFFVHNYRGYEVASHGGNMPGAATTVLLIPKERIGVVVLTNRSAARLRDGLPFEIADRLLGLPSVKMVERYGELEKKGFAGEDAAQAAGASDRKPGTKPSHELAEYVGRYTDPGYGPLDVKLENGSLTLTYNSFTARLDHWHYDVFQAPEDRTSRLDRARVQFRTDLEGEVSGVAVPMDPNVEPIVFAKEPPEEMMQPAFLQGLLGIYEVGGVPLQIVLREDAVLQLVQLGTVYELVPVRGRLFRFKQLTGVSVEFLVGPDGAVDRIAVHEGGSTVGPRKE